MSGARSCNLENTDSITRYVELKIKRNKKMQEMLKLQNKILKKEILLNYKAHEINKKKIDHVEEINKIEQEQLVNFLFERENALRKSYIEINDLTVENYEELKLEITAMHNDCIKLLQQFNELNGQIPESSQSIYISK